MGAGFNAALVPGSDSDTRRAEAGRNLAPSAAKWRKLVQRSLKSAQTTPTPFCRSVPRASELPRSCRNVTHRLRPGPIVVPATIRTGLRTGWARGPVLFVAGMLAGGLCAIVLSSDRPAQARRAVVRVQPSVKPQSVVTNSAIPAPLPVATSGTTNPIAVADRARPLERKKKPAPALSSG